MKKKKNNLIYNVLLVLLNMVLIFCAIIGSLLYSKEVNNEQIQNKVDIFINNVEAMKQVSLNYFNSEMGYVNNWENYISSNDMNLEQALDFLRNVNTNTERIAHIVDMDTLKAYSSYYEKGKEEIGTYLKFSSSSSGENPYESLFVKNMREMFEGKRTVLSQYQLNEKYGKYGISVGKKVRLKEGTQYKDYLLLRVILASDVKNNWVFPVEYKIAEVGIITNSGDYVLKSNSMKSGSFLEYIRGYNFEDDYNKVYDLKKQLSTTKSGILEYNDFRDNTCIWYYSSLGENSDIDILGFINKEELYEVTNNWFVVLIISGTILLLSIIDSIYLYNINKELKETALLAKQASKSKTYFLSAMSHDIRTPLNAVLGMIDIAKKNLDNPEYVSDCLDKSTSAGKQLMTLVNDILDISQIESGKLPMFSSMASLNGIFEELEVILTPTAAYKSIKLEYDIKDLPYDYVLVDKSRLKQICLNLLSNAIKYTNYGGNVWLKVNEELIDPEHVCLTIVVEDNGIGMSEEFQKNMYQSFARAVSTQVNNVQGTGLGLYIVKLVISAMNGTIDCESKLNVGTKFTVKLNLEVVNNQEIAKTNQNDYSKLNDINVLIAEDNELNREIIVALLNEYDVKCETVENGLECVKKLQNSQPNIYDIILMDIHMPVMDGLEATNKIRNLSNGYKNIPIVAMTADAFKENIQEFLEKGMNDHVAKPIDIELLLKKICKLVKKENK